MIPDSETRWCWCVRRAMWKYQSIGIARKSCTARAVISGSATGSMNPLCDTTAVVRRPTGSRCAMGLSRTPAYRMVRDRLTVMAWRRNRGRRVGASIVAKVPPGTPATAKRPLTREGWRCASSNIVLTPMDQPMTGTRSAPAASSTATASSTNSSTPTRLRSTGRSDPPIPRWFQEITRTSQSDRRKAGQVQAPVPRPLQSSTVGPAIRQSGSLVHASSRVPSALTTS